MFFTAIINIATVCIGVVIVWGWVAFISESIARRTGRKNAVPYPDEVLWAHLCQGKFADEETEVQKKPPEARLY